MRLPYNDRRFVRLIETDTIGPVARFLHQSRPHRVLTNVLPFLFRRFIGSEQSIETAGLPLPRRLQILTHKSLDRSRGVFNPRLAFDWCDQEMDMIGHQDGGNHIPFRQRAIAALNAAKASSLASTFWRLATQKVRK